jgi:iron(III) transport system permease protein
MLGPIYISQLVLALGWYVLYGPAGYMSLMVQQWLGETPWNLASIPGMGVLGGLAMAPAVMLFCTSSLALMDASLEDAARGLGASWLMTMRRVIVPAARPGLVAGGLLAAVAAVGEFVASVVLYTHANRPISMEILAQLRALAFGTAAAYSVLLILLVLMMTLAARSFEERLA